MTSQSVASFCRKDEKYPFGDTRGQMGLIPVSNCPTKQIEYQLKIDTQACKFTFRFLDMDFLHTHHHLQVQETLQIDLVCPLVRLESGRNKFLDKHLAYEFGAWILMEVHFQMAIESRDNFRNLSSEVSDNFTEFP